ncbi:hypothetical protein WA026_015653 [Henosepilachna vigintioctopunctata]|uniref:Protein trunk n=1 Tax=Henosepilachna vigintioctopunctata TaxID=420089 RepID=A0AAW1VAG2_9CUCU
MAFNISHRFSIIFYIFIIYLFINETLCFVHQMDQSCEEMPEEALEEILGSAYNWRYMSITKPIILYHEVNLESKRNVVYDNEYDVTDDHLVKLTEEPAWEVRSHVKLRRNSTTPLQKRRKRQTIQSLEEWHCESEFVWEDLGPDYFPRYIHNLKCTSENCWFTRFKCKRRSFTLKILKKELGQCAEIGPETLRTFDGLTKTWRQVWIWAEIAVNFCCECAIY